MSKIKEILKKSKYGFEDLLAIMKILRSEDGCPWDREQDHKSIRNNFIEEVYEFIEGIDTDDQTIMCEELGDVLLQIVFHSEMASERDAFDIADVCNGICKKLILRHPHIFAGEKVDGAKEVLKNWDSIKVEEKGQKTVGEQMAQISKALPSLIRAAKIQSKAAKVGFDFSNAADALGKVKEELFEVERELESGTPERIFEELGDLFFAVVNASRLAGVDAEEALTFAGEKFYRRFSEMERQIHENSRCFSDMSLEEMEQYWNNVKRNC